VIDLRLLRDNPDVVRASQQARGEAPELVDAALDADARRRSSLTEFDCQRDYRLAW
jgi:seryl-tRNA synthetase